MIKLILINLIRFAFLILFQVLFLKNLSLYSLAVPYLYVLFILLLPLELPAWALFILAFSLGISVDIFSNSLGVHASACVFMAFGRILLLKVFTPKGGYEGETNPSLENMGLRWFFTYTTILVILHHLFLFNIEVFRVNEFFLTLTRALLSSIFTISLIMLSQYLFIQNRSRRV